MQPLNLKLFYLKKNEATIIFYHNKILAVLPKINI